LQLILAVILGGAAVYRCDTWLIFSIGFSRWGAAATLRHFFRNLFSRAARTQSRSLPTTND